MPLGLLWRNGFSATQKQLGTRITPYRAPIWPWASMLDLDLRSTGGDRLFRDIKTKYAEVISAECFPAGKDPIGAVSFSYIMLLTPLAEVERVPHGEEIEKGSQKRLAEGDFRYLRPLRGRKMFGHRQSEMSPLS